MPPLDCFGNDLIGDKLARLLLRRIIRLRNKIRNLRKLSGNQMPALRKFNRIGKQFGIPRIAERQRMPVFHKGFDERQDGSQVFISQRHHRIEFCAHLEQLIKVGILLIENLIGIFTADDANLQLCRNRFGL